MKLAEANIRTYYRGNPRSAADISKVEAEAVKELINVVSKGGVRRITGNTIVFRSSFITYVWKVQITI